VTDDPPPDGPAPERLAALVAARMCHDLANPLGAIGNGLELLGVSGPRQGPEMTLIGESLAAARVRLQLFRLAFGPPSGGAPLARRDLLAMFEVLTRGTRLAIDWRLPDPEIDRGTAKLAVLMIQCAESALPFGGTIAVERRADGGLALTAASARRLAVEPAHWAALADPAAGAGLGPGEVQFLLAGHELRRQGRRFEAEIDDTIRLSF
jgi:histidine phosphotransferase ChpT